MLQRRYTKLIRGQQRSKSCGISAAARSAAMNISGANMHNRVVPRRCSHAAAGRVAPANCLSRGRKSRNGTVAVNTADLPVDLKGQPKPHHHSSSTTTTGSQCPFLAGLRTPPVVNISWLRRVQLQLTAPWKFQQELLKDRGTDTVVQVPQQPFFSSFYLPATPELVKDVFAAESAGAATQGLATGSSFKAFAVLFGEDSLLIVEDHQRHKQLRALMQPAFSSEAIATYLPAIEALVDRHLADWEAAGPSGIKAHKGLKALTFEFILQVVMGRAILQPELLQLSSLFSDITSGITAWPWLELPFSSWSKALAARQQLMAYFQEGVMDARQQLSAGHEVPGVLGRLVAAVDEEGNRLSDKEICDNLLPVLFAGHDTSSTTLTRCMSNLQDRPHVLDKLRSEQKAVVAKRGPQISAAALKDMVYAEAVIRETLRCDPVVGAVIRVATTDQQLGGYAVPSGTSLLLPLRTLAETDPRWVAATGELGPHLFNPDRMLGPEGSKQGQLMPFGNGVRFCLGAGLAMAEMKVYLALLARSYAFTADNNTDWKPALGQYPENGLPLVLTRNA